MKNLNYLKNQYRDHDNDDDDDNEPDVPSK